MGNHSSVKHLPAPCSALLSLCRPGRSSPLLPSTAGIPAPATWKLCQGIRACAVSCGSGRPQGKVAGHSLSFLLLVFSLVQFSRSVVSDSLRPHESQHTRLLCSWNLPGKNTGVGCHFLFQGIFPTQGSNLRLLCLLHWQADSLPLASLGKHMYEEP